MFLHFNGLFMSCSLSFFSLFLMIDWIYWKAALKATTREKEKDLKSVLPFSSVPDCESTLLISSFHYTHSWVSSLATQSVEDIVNIFIRIMRNVNYFICLILISFSFDDSLTDKTFCSDWISVVTSHAPGVNY